jgi:hypothetical protein
LTRQKNEAKKSASQLLPAVPPIAGASSSALTSSKKDLKTETVYVISKLSNSGQNKIKKKLKVLSTTSSEGGSGEAAKTSTAKIEYYDDEKLKYLLKEKTSKPNVYSTTSSSSTSKLKKNQQTFIVDDNQPSSTSESDDVDTVKLVNSSINKKMSKSNDSKLNDHRHNHNHHHHHHHQQQQPSQQQPKSKMSSNSKGHVTYESNDLKSKPRTLEGTTTTSTGFFGSSLLTSQPNLEMSMYSTTTISNLNRTKPKTSREILQEIARLTNGTTPSIKSNQTNNGASVSFNTGPPNLSDLECSFSSHSRVLNPNFKSNTNPCGKK